MYITEKCEYIHLIVYCFCKFKEWQIVLYHSVVPQRIANVDVNRTITEDRPLLTVEWSTPSSDRPIQHYQVDYRVGTSGSWSTWSPNPTFTSVTLTGLQRGTIYQVRVRAVSDVGNGEWSELIGKTTYSGEFYIFIKFIKFSVLCAFNT